MTIKSLASFLLFLLIALSTLGGPPTTDNHIKVDQFGYRCSDQKIAIISNPQSGFNSGSPFSPGTGTNQYQLRNWSDDAVVYSGTLKAWKNNTIHTQSGDKIWWFDFSSYNVSGTYYVFDVTQNVGSYQFEIRENIYKEVLKQAMRTYYYQRCGFDKTAAYAGTAWADGASHIGTEQDTDCRLYSNTTVGTSKNLSGGWYDAGDYNKYVNFAWTAVHDLLFAYEETPSAWEDNYNIPESGNSIPDVLDEIKFELDWLLKMQNSDGSVLSLVGGGSESPPSADTDYRRYGPATTAATWSAASMYAHGAIVFKSLGIPAMTSYANTLETAAINAWNWAAANPGIKFYNQGVLAAGEQEFSTDPTDYNYSIVTRRLSAASFLYNLTGTATYKTYFESNYTGSHLYQWNYAYPFEGSEQDALLYYSKAAGITASVGTTIKNRYSNSVSTGADNLDGYNDSTDAYRAHLKDQDYGWGSNSTKCKQGNMFMTMNKYSMNNTNAANYINAASGFLHYIHGVNPMALAYISNMSAYGAENSVNEFYHSWFKDGSSLWDRVETSTYGPPPGYIPGGPNPDWDVAACCPSGCGAGNNALCNVTDPPDTTLVQKAYKDWNTSWPQNSWEVTENGIYYNASYIRLVSKFTTSSGICGTAMDVQEETTLNNMEVNVFPNPFDQHTTIEVISTFREKIQIRILSPIGKELMSAGNYFTNEPIELGQDLKEGLLILEIKNKDKISIVKLIKN